MVKLKGVWFYHRVSQGVPFYHSSVIEELPLIPAGASNGH